MFNKWLKACSVLPALLITPALADTVTKPTEDLNGNHYFVSNGSTLTLGKSDVNSVDGVYSDWYHAVAGGVVQNYLGSVVVEDETIFSNNASYIRTEEQVPEKGGAEMGGAIYAQGDSTEYATTEIGNNVEFNGNIASAGGAIFLYGGNIVNFGDNVKFSGNKGTWNLPEDSFSEPSATGTGYGGAIASTKADVQEDPNKLGPDNGNAILTFKGKSTFEDNVADRQGGAISLYGSQATFNGDALFTGNTALAPSEGRVKGGGAISATDSEFVFNEGAAFANNSATGAGGAIWNGVFEGSSSMTFNGSASFENNSANNGGAIYNDGNMKFAGNAQFTGNNAAKLGGAIHNEGTITFDGNNVFADNIANGIANDINNKGTLNIASGTTTLGGGITGDGTLTLASGATLDIGSAKVVQKTIDLNGDIVASIVNANSFGQFVGDVDLSTDSELTLDVGAAGEYSIFAEAEIAADKITYNDSVFNLTTDGNKIVVSTKSVDEIMENTNLSMGAANAVSIIANTNDDVLNTISLMAQQDLVAGKTGNAEKELAKLNPDDKPVAQSVASSVQNQVLSLAAGRMSGASVGRSGGDLTSADYGMWVQGLYNHSKYSGRFSGDTMGISVGADTLIDGKYTLGIGYAYNDTDVDSNSRDTAIESHSVFLYGQYKPNEWYVNAALNYTMSNYTESADVYGVKLADAEYDVNSFGGQIMTGYDFVAGNPASIFTPEVGVRYLHVAQDAYQGTLGDVDALDTDYLTGVAGVKYAFEIESASELKFRPELRAAATYDFMSDAAVATVNAPGNVSYVIDADRLSRFGGEFGIGLAAQYRGLEVSLNYDLDMHEDYTSQTGMLKFRYDF